LHETRTRHTTYDRVHTCYINFIFFPLVFLPLSFRRHARVYGKMIFPSNFLSFSPSRITFLIFVGTPPDECISETFSGRYERRRTDKYNATRALCTVCKRLKRSHRRNICVRTFCGRSWATTDRIIDAFYLRNTILSNKSRRESLVFLWLFLIRRGVKYRSKNDLTRFSHRAISLLTTALLGWWKSGGRYWQNQKEKMSVSTFRVPFVLNL